MQVDKFSKILVYLLGKQRREEFTWEIGIKEESRERKEIIYIAYNILLISLI
jgi:hypothetical protein